MTLPTTRITTALAAAKTYDLTDLATAKDELGITDTNSDAWLSRGISQVSRSVMNETNRVFAPEFVQDVFQFGIDPAFAGVRFAGDNDLALSRWPLLSIASVTQARPDGSSVALAVGTDFVADMVSGRLMRLSSGGLAQRWEAYPVTIQYSAGYGAAVAETHTVPGAPYQVTVDGSAAFSCDQSVSSSGAAFARVASAPAPSQYTVTTAGLYTFNPADTGKSLAFAYCTADMPDDLVDATLRLITNRFKGKGRDPALIQRETPGVGIERWWFGGAPGQRGAFPPDIQAILDNYTVPTVA